MSQYLLLGGSCVLIGFALGGGLLHELDGTALAREQAAHAKDNKANADTLAAINSASATQLADALTKQQAAEGKVSELETNFQNEVNAHASDSLKYRADLASGAQRVRVHVASCDSGAAASQSTAAASSTNAASATADLSPATASVVVAVADSADETAMRLAALQSYVKTLQEQGYIGK
jgi:prophage endopeptidase